MQVVAEKDLGRYEIAMSSWGVQEPIVEESFRVAVLRRIDFIWSLFLELGFEGQELETRTLAFVGYMRMIHESRPDKVRGDHLKHLDERHAILTGT